MQRDYISDNQVVTFILFFFLFFISKKTLCYLALPMRRAAGLRVPTFDVIRGGVLATIDRDI